MITFRLQTQWWHRL